MRLDEFFDIKSVAVIGASKDPRKVGYAILKNLVDRFEGKIFPINLKEDEILGLKCYKDVFSVAEEINLAIFVIPAKTWKTVIPAKAGIQIV